MVAPRSERRDAARGEPSKGGAGKQLGAALHGMSFAISRDVEGENDGTECLLKHGRQEHGSWERRQGRPRQMWRWGQRGEWRTWRR